MKRRDEIVSAAVSNILSFLAIVMDVSEELDYEWVVKKLIQGIIVKVENMWRTHERKGDPCSL